MPVTYSATLVPGRFYRQDPGSSWRLRRADPARPPARLVAASEIEDSTRQLLWVGEVWHPFECSQPLIHTFDKLLAYRTVLAYRYEQCKPRSCTDAST